MIAATEKHQNNENIIQGIDELAFVLREKLNRIKNGDNQGLIDKDGKPVNSLRKLAKYMDYEGGFSYLSKFANEKSLPCIVTLNKIANAFNIKYMIGNFYD